jgi:hypothetical protein
VNGFFSQRHKPPSFCWWFQPCQLSCFVYRGAAKDGGTLEYVFEAGEQNSPNAVTKEKAADIAAEILPMKIIDTDWLKG